MTNKVSSSYLMGTAEYWQAQLIHLSITACSFSDCVLPSSWQSNSNSYPISIMKSTSAPACLLMTRTVKPALSFWPPPSPVLLSLLQSRKHAIYHSWAYSSTSLDDLAPDAVSLYIYTVLWSTCHHRSASKAECIFVFFIIKRVFHKGS